MTGYGSRATVLKGSLRGRLVAVKQVQDSNSAAHEVSILRVCDSHPNIVQYYYHEDHCGSTYIALELCLGSLTDIIEGSRSRPPLPLGHHAVKQLSGSGLSAPNNIEYS